MKTLEIHNMPVVQSYPDSKTPWVVVEPCRFTYGGELFAIPVGYKTDLASVPRIPFVYARYGGQAREAAVIHDFCYDCLTGLLTREEADWIFWAAMDMTNNPPSRSKRLMMWLGVRIGGWRGWRTPTQHKCGG